MAKQQCYLCHKECGALTVKMKHGQFEACQIPIPDGMQQDQFTCHGCFSKLEKTAKEVRQDEKENDNEVREEVKAMEKELFSRTNEYKKYWLKTGIIQFKNERVAILKRAWGSQVQFIIAFDDLTKEGYELKAIDEGVQAGQASGGFTGGISSYYYFQKKEYLK